MPVVLQPFGCDPLQRRPTVWRIPLLTAVNGSGGNTTGFQQTRRGGLRHFIGAILRSRIHIQREERSGGQLVTDLFGFQVVIGIPALFIIPQVALHRLLACARQAVIFAGRGAITRFLAGFCQQFFHLEHQGVQIHRHNAGGAYGAQLFRVVHPARTEVPAGSGRSTQIPVDLRRRSIGVVFGGSHIIHPRLRTRRITVVPVAVKNGSVIQFHHALISLARLECIDPLHPVGMLFLHLRTVLLQRLGIVGRQ